jgi:hypothetical protein
MPKIRARAGSVKSNFVSKKYYESPSLSLADGYKIFKIEK